MPWFLPILAVLIPIPHQSIYLSPYNTTANAEWIYPGAYLKTVFTGTSATLHIDTHSNQGAPPKFRWSIDGHALQTGEATESLELAKNLTVTAHTLTLYLAASDANYDRWNTPTQIIKLKSLEIDNGANIKPPRKRSHKRALFFGDSITEGAWVLGDSYRVVGKKYVDWVKHSDATQAWPFHLAETMNVEYGVVASGGMGWLRPSHSNIPPLPESWRWHYKGQPRRWGKAPNYIIVNMGTNDGDKDTTAIAAQWLRAVRHEFRNAKIILLIPFGQQNKSRLEAAVQSSAIKNIQVIDLGPSFATGLQKYGHHSETSHDGLHPNAATNKRLAAAIQQMLYSPAK